ncbi:hypothetical protein J462_3541, partial [Acinetobacter baumannii 972082]
LTLNIKKTVVTFFYNQDVFYHSNSSIAKNKTQVADIYIIFT